MRFAFLLLFSFSLFQLKAQDTSEALEKGLVEGDTIKINKKEGKYYDPKKAARRSAIIPGWGQIYNDSWWKVPVLYGGLGIAFYYVGFNEEQHDRWLDEYYEEIAKDDPNENLVRIYSRRADTWRKNRDTVILTMIGIYGLQIIDATVDAHLKGFNVDEDLALNLKPKFGVISNGTPFIGMKLTLPIGQ